MLTLPDIVKASGINLKHRADLQQNLSIGHLDPRLAKGGCRYSIVAGESRPVSAKGFHHRTHFTLVVEKIQIGNRNCRHGHGIQCSDHSGDAVLSSVGTKRTSPGGKDSPVISLAPSNDAA